jgi:hypothetical protein
MERYSNNSSTLSILKCHYCDRSADSRFLYDLNSNVDSKRRNSIPACTEHFNDLCDIAYQIHNSDLLKSLPAGQREYLAVKRLEKKFGITTHHK